MVTKKQIRATEMQQHAQEAVSFLKAFANTKRMEILCLLASKEMAVNEINSHLNITQSSLSQHLAELRKADLVNRRRESQTIFYSLAGDRTVRTMLLLQDMFCQPPQ